MTFSIAVRAEPDECVLDLSGDLDLAGIDHLRKVIGDALAGDATHVTVDLTDLVFIDSTGIGELVRGRSDADERGVAYRVVGARGQVENVLTLVGVVDYLAG